MLVRRVNFSRNQHRPQNVAWVGVGKMMMMIFVWGRQTHKDKELELSVWQMQATAQAPG